MVVAVAPPERAGSSNVAAPRKLSDEQREARDLELKKLETTGNKRAYEYDMTHPFKILVRVKGTFWPLVMTRYELYFFPLIHLGLVLYAHFEGDAGYDDGDFWGEPSNMLPWGALGLSELSIQF